MGQRFATTAAMEALALRFGLPYSTSMQDWPWEVADPARLDDFLAAYEKGELSDDERFVLMEMILQSFEELAVDPTTDSRWHRAIAYLAEHQDVHASSIRYWASLGVEPSSEQWHIAPAIRRWAQIHDAHAEGHNDRSGRPTRS